ncbi:hypothetical protein LPC10_00710 [Methylorubrum sp. B1-46]|uniref:hypothetical protein n=1 Tax=Methylorubrum sp. B1-46 TaxID=2897334 RepID=UPI0007C8ACA1|nr:hypothetical protein [Methylorubrum sp. B1-46]OAH25835.1 hypothetical protein AX289_30425 [Methylorubrum populi]UGB26196.1 hypothetical protein LPC10_00710 [Methylorubrum sp. B1-46]
MRLRFRSTILSVTLALASPCLAAGPNGGQTTVADGHPIEFVATDTGITFFVTGEDGKPVETAGLAAKAFVQVGGKTETLVLKPAAPNKLAADLKGPLTAGAKVVLSAKVHGHNIQARFENQ